MTEKNADGTELRPRVGLGVLIQNQAGQVLLGLRKGSHGAGEWCFPGGHLEFGETVFETAKREVVEEVGLDVSMEDMELISVADEMRYIKTDNKHYLNLGVKAVYKGGEPQLMEPHRCEGWKWYDLDALPERMYEGTHLIINNYLAKKIY
jgi:8-oxo-dGTP diphosphatase